MAEIVSGLQNVKGFSLVNENLLLFANFSILSSITVLIFVCLCAAGFRHWALYMLGKCCAMELCSQPSCATSEEKQFFFFFTLFCMSEAGVANSVL